jgi:UPF0716 family protein affecting phage T7 exclusion
MRMYNTMTSTHSRAEHIVLLVLLFAMSGVAGYLFVSTGDLRTELRAQKAQYEAVVHENAMLRSQLATVLQCPPSEVVTLPIAIAQLQAWIRDDFKATRDIRDNTEKILDKLQ